MYLITQIELSDVQNTVSALEEKLKWWKKLYPYATFEISQIETDDCFMINTKERSI